MAKVIYGGGVAGIQGKVGGSVHSRTRGGPAMRNKAKPNNPATPAQMAQRAQLSRLSQAWRALTEEQRTAWTKSAETIVTKGVCGNIINLTGNQHYVRVNSLRESNGDATAAGTPPGMADFDGQVFGTTDNFTASVSGDAISVPLGDDGVEGIKVAVWATAPRSPGKAAYKGVMRKTYEGAITADQETAGSFEITAEWKEKFGALTGTAGKAITIGCREYQDGEYSVSEIMKTVITA